MKAKPLREKVGNVSVPIYRTPSREYDGFTVAWKEGDKRCRKFFGNLTDARNHARLVATKIENQERQVLTVTPEEARIMIVAREIVGDYPILQALKFWKKHHDQALPIKTVAEVVAELVKGLEQDGASAVHVSEMKRALGKFVRTFPVPIGDITTTDINHYLRALDVSAGTRNVYRRKVVTLFNYARRVGYLPDRATAATKSAKAKNPLKETEIFTADEMAKLIEHATDSMRPFIVLCGFCGLRSSEAMRLDWSEIDFERGTILVTAAKSKTQSRRFAPLSDNAAAWLRSFSKPSGRVVPIARIVKALSRLGTRAKVEMKRNALRHSFCSYRLAVTQNANQTALEAGHSPTVLFKHYRQLCTAAEANRWFSIRPADADVVTFGAAA